ncbi:PKD domain-containing protein [Actinomadura latina]|uniref:PKD domain-containing protein n=1 Tax=Actinomadura latina TaxID=163603 RepID=A0A846ZFE1_9ACTN|nr:PKD domain-containing protein [Actinomadura latina]NKZ08816.1 PKD domain-containing protein [Actinomadura latina]
MGRRRWGALAASAAFALGTLTASLVAAVPAHADQRGSEPGHGRVVNADPANYTPNVVDGDVKSIIKIGGKIYVGGSFTQVKEPGANKPTLTRDRLFAFDASTGAIDPNFAPSLNKGEASVLLPAPDGQSIYVGGSFSEINGTRQFVLARIDAQTGAPITAFKPQLDARVRDLRFAGGRLYVAGTFATAGGAARAGLATLNPQTGARDDFVDLNIAGTQTGDGVTQIYKMDISPDGSKLVGIGNFSSVAGSTRRQIVMLDLTGASAQLANWDTTRYGDQCSQSFDTYMRDVEFSPDGAYFVVTTTGAYGGSAKLCDTQARWESAATGAGQQPTWVNYTGGDTTYAVEITDSAVYAGGHFRWANNPFAGDKPGQGAVSREGIVALDPASGLPFSWNPGRDKGVGVFDMLATGEGLWVGSDTDNIGGEYHQKLALMPLAGGKAVPPSSTGELPGNVYSGGGIGNGAANYLKHRSFDGTAAGAEVADATGGVDWRSARGAFMINGDLFYGGSDGSFNRRAFDGTTLGPVTEIDAADQLVTMTTWHSQVASITGMFFANGRVYYTRGQSALYYRMFNPESNVVGAQEFTAVGNLPGMSWSSVGGMFVNGGDLYYVGNTSGKLYRVAFSAAGVPSGASTEVSSADWRGRAVFLFAGTPNTAPQAAFTANCDKLDCAFDASGSADPDGSIASYAWDFGDGGTGTGATPQHTYADAGEYTVKLTVTDDRGGKGTKTQTLTVAANQANIAFRAGIGGNANVQTAYAQIPPSVQAGDGMILMLTFNSGSASLTTPPAGWTQVDTQTVGSATSVLWKRVAQAGDAGKQVDIGLSAFTKADIQLLAYDGTNTTDPVAAVAKGGDADSVTAHTSPNAQVGGTGSWAVTYWADKSSSTTSWTAPAGVETRRIGIGSGGGRITSLTVDSNGTVATGTYGGKTATTDAASRAGMWTIILAQGDSAATNEAPQAAFSRSCDDLQCTFDASGSADPDGSIASYAWDFGNGQNGTGATPQHAYDAAGTYTVKLTVTDDKGAKDTRSETVTVAPDQADISYRAGVGGNANVKTAYAQIPASVQPGDGLIMVLTFNSSDAELTTPPAGWTKVDDQNAGNATSVLFKRVAQAGDAGKQVDIGLSAYTKADIRLMAYAGTDTTDPIAKVAKDTDDDSGTQHTSPDADVTTSGGWAITYWADKSSSTTSWTAPAGVETRGTGIGSGGGRITSLTVDSNAAVPTGSYGGKTATTNAASRAAMWTIILKRK